MGMKLEVGRGQRVLRLPKAGQGARPCPEGYGKPAKGFKVNPR